MSALPTRTLAILACAAGIALPAAAQTPEDVRHEADLRACAQLTDERRRTECVARVQAQIRAERIQRVERVFQGRQPN